jgi:hypothetical protein
MKSTQLFKTPTKIVAAGMVLVLSLHVQAAPISLQEAQNVALNWMAMKTGTQFQIKETGNLASGATSSDAKAYRIVQLEPQGWAIISSDDAVKPILGYGQSSMNTVSLPPAFAAWMGEMDKAIKHAVEAAGQKNTGLGALPPAQTEWNRLKKDPDLFYNELASQQLGASPYVVAPLLWLGGSTENSGILWNQDDYYNAKAPVDANGPDNHALTGCVATAMGQVMRYYGEPSSGTGSYTYTNSIANGYQHDYGVQTANFGATAYDWPNMPVQLTAGSNAAEVSAVSTLLYQAGVSVAMDYGTGNGDGGSLSAYHDSTGGAAADSAMKNYFGFSKAEWKERVNSKTGVANYTWEEWKAILKESLDDSNPLLYAGIGTGGHAFVMDGYASDGTFHFNWGWGGQLNGQFSLFDLTPGPYNFNNQQQAIFIKGVGSGRSGGGSGSALGYLFPLLGLYLLYRRRKYAA